MKSSAETILLIGKQLDVIQECRSILDKRNKGKKDKAVKVQHAIQSADEIKLNEDIETGLKVTDSQTVIEEKLTRAYVLTNTIIIILTVFFLHYYSFFIDVTSRVRPY